MSKAHWLALAALPGLGAVTLRKLLEHFGNVESLWLASPDDLVAFPRVTRAMVEQLRATPLEIWEAQVHALAQAKVDLLTWDNPRFPSALVDLRDSPIILFMRGSLKSEDSYAAAIVGARSPSREGMERAARLARELAERGLTIVSGLALGIDSAAHRGALAAEEGRTVAVLGSGILRVHPQENAELAEAIAARGAVLSELLPDAPPRGPQLMARDRIISGLARAVIVVEAAAKGGSLDTAKRAEKQGRLVYAVPGSAGTDGLLRTGARPLDLDISPDALAEEIRRHQPTRRDAPFSNPQIPLL